MYLHNAEHKTSSRPVLLLRARTLRGQLAVVFTIGRRKSMSLRRDLTGTDNQWVLLLPTAICTAQSEALGTRITFFFSKLIAVKAPDKSQPLSYLWLYPARAWNICMTAGGGKGPTLLSPWEMKYLQSAPSIYQLQINSRSGSDSSYFSDDSLDKALSVLLLRLVRSCSALLLQIKVQNSI